MVSPGGSWNVGRDHRSPRQGRQVRGSRSGAARDTGQAHPRTRDPAPLTAKARVSCSATRQKGNTRMFRSSFLVTSRVLAGQGWAGSRPGSGSTRPGAIAAGAMGPKPDGSWGSSSGTSSMAEATAGTSSSSAEAEAGDTSRRSSTGVSGSSWTGSRHEAGPPRVSGASCLCRGSGAGHRERVTPGLIPRTLQ